MSGGTGYGSLDLHQELPDIFTGKKKKKPSKVKGSGRFRRGQKSIQILKPLQQIIDESPYNHKTHPDGLTIYHKSSANPEERYSGKKLRIRKDHQKFFDGITPQECVVSDVKKDRTLFRVYPKELSRAYNKSFVVYETWLLGDSYILPEELFEI